MFGESSRNLGKSILERRHGSGAAALAVVEEETECRQRTACSSQRPQTVESEGQPGKHQGREVGMRWPDYDDVGRFAASSRVNS